MKTENASSNKNIAQKTRCVIMEVWMCSISLLFDCSNAFESISFDDWIWLNERSEKERWIEKKTTYTYKFLMSQSASQPASQSATQFASFMTKGEWTSVEKEPSSAEALPVYSHEPYMYIIERHNM